MKLTSITDLKNDENKALLLRRELNLSHLFDDFLDQDEKGDDHRAPGVHASELNTCQRMVFYTLNSTKKVKRVPKDMKKRFLVGHAIHAMLQSQFHKMVEDKGGFITFEDEVKTGSTTLGTYLNIQSSCDGVFTIHERREDGTTAPIMRIGLEIKTEAPDSYASLKAPRPKHIEQAHVYMACLDLPVMWFLYWNKGNQNITPMRYPWLVSFDEAIWAKLKERAENSLIAAEDNVAPDREEGGHCSWCPYAYTCKPATGIIRQPGDNTHIKPIRK